MAVPRSSASVPEGPQAADLVVCDSPQLNAPLENLPPEVRRQILSLLELEDLSALVHASPVFHQQYLLDRRSLLGKYLETTLRSVTIDAYAVYQSGLTDFSGARTREKVPELLKLYQDRHASARYWILTRKITEDEVVGMAVFLSSIFKIFICIFEPWEVEEIACIHTFAKEKYDQIFCDIHWDMHEGNPKFEGQRPPTPEGAFDLDNSWVRESLLNGTISRGLELPHTVSFEIRDHAHLVSTMQRHISWPPGNFLEDEALGEAAQFQRRQERLSNRDQKQQRRDPLPFRGDAEPDANGLRPPLAWTLMWRGTYSNLYGYYVQDVIRRWGYVMWDAPRLERTGAREVLARQWEADWGDGDPRDNLL